MHNALPPVEFGSTRQIIMHYALCIKNSLCYTCFSQTIPNEASKVEEAFAYHHCR